MASVRERAPSDKAKLPIGKFFYAATSCDWQLCDTSRPVSLKRFIRTLTDNFHDTYGDVAVWKANEGGLGMRLVAILTRGADGEAAVRVL